jgi:mannose-6-phosphate isomerase
MGAHPAAQSVVVRYGVRAGLADVIASAPRSEIGEDSLARFGPRLPFLVKVLAASAPLSLQAHPDAARARAGFDEEQRRGVPLSATHRNYKDSSHKPELIVALGPFEALCGFRDVHETIRLFDEIALPELEPVLAPLRASKDDVGLAHTFSSLMTLPKAEAAAIVTRLAEASASRGPSTSAFPNEHAWCVRLASLYPGDVGVIGALLMNLVHLEAGEGLYLGAGQLHAYLDGVGVEIMASSDNVLRGGLTPKHVDVQELMHVLTFTDGPARRLQAQPIDAAERHWETPAPEFQLSTLEITADAPVPRDVHGPEILLCTRGRVRILPEDGSSTVTLSPGAGAFVPASTGRYVVTCSDEHSGVACLYRARVNFT